MIITNIRVVPLNYKLFKPFVYSGVTLETLEYALVRIETQDHIVGYGECPAYCEPRGETQKSTIDAVNLVAKHLVGQNCTNIEERLVIFSKVIPRAYAAQCGIDMACYDIVGKAKNVSVAQLLGQPQPVPVEAAIPMNDQSSVIAIVEKAQADGISVFKVKVGMDTDKEAELLKLIRSKIGDSVILFVDANQAWKTVKEAEVALQRFAKAQLAWAEQPLSVKATAEEWLELKKKSGVKIMLDESVYTAEDAEYYAKLGIADLFNIKLAKAGGISGAINLYETVKKYNLSCMLGSMIEGTLATFAGLAFASAKPMVTTALLAYKYIDDELVYGPEVRDGFMQAPTLPGLGYRDAALFEKHF